jgi:hypothetical protein
MPVSRWVTLEITDPQPSTSLSCKVDPHSLARSRGRVEPKPDNGPKSAEHPHAPGTTAPADDTPEPNRHDNTTTPGERGGEGQRGEEEGLGGRGKVAHCRHGQR